MSGSDVVPTASDSALVTLASDGTFHRTRRESESTEDALLARLSNERSLLGTRTDDAVASVPAVSVGGATPWDDVLPATLAHLSISGDLAPYGWRLGPGTGIGWHTNRAWHDRIFEAARMAYLGYSGPVHLTRMGPALLASATFTAGGDKVVSDPGLVRELPFLVSEAWGSIVDALAPRVPGARVSPVIDERGSRHVLAGTMRTVSGYRFYKPVGTHGMSELWGRFLSSMPSNANPATLLLDSRADSLTAALDAGALSIGMDPCAGELRTPGPLWEKLAEARERGVALTFLARADRAEKTAHHMLAAWQRLGYSPRDAQGTTFMISNGALTTPSAPRVPEGYLTATQIDALLRMAPAFAEKVAD